MSMYSPLDIYWDQSELLSPFSTEKQVKFGEISKVEIERVLQQELPSCQVL